MENIFNEWNLQQMTNENLFIRFRIPFLSLWVLNFFFFFLNKSFILGGGGFISGY